MNNKSQAPRNPSSIANGASNGVDIQHELEVAARNALKNKSIQAIKSTVDRVKEKSSHSSNHKLSERDPSLKPRPSPASEYRNPPSLPGDNFVQSNSDTRFQPTRSGSFIESWANDLMSAVFQGEDSNVPEARPMSLTWDREALYLM